MENKHKEKESNMNQIFISFKNFLKEIKYEGYFGIAKFLDVYEELMPVQQEKLNEIVKRKINEYKLTGSIISIGICYKSETIYNINVKNSDGTIDKKRWGLYTQEYMNLNNLLTTIGKKIANNINGILIPPIVDIPDEEINNVIEYFPQTISHRIVAENAGIGWRGKNELLVTEDHGPALRFTSILINMPLTQNKKQENKCGKCTACLDVCHILKNKKKIENYREICRRYMLGLGLKAAICGKCIKTCLKQKEKKL